MDRVDLEIPPVERAVSVVVIDLACSLWVFGSLDRECYTACWPKLLTRVLLVRREGRPWIGSRLLSAIAFDSLRNHERRSEADAHRRPPAQCVMRMDVRGFVNAPRSG